MKKLNIKELGLDDDYIIENEGIENAISTIYLALRETIDLVNSQQEAIGELQTEIGVLRNMVLQSQEAIEKLQEHVDHEARHVSESADDTQLIAGYTIEELKKIADTHRTVTLRIPKGMTVGEIFEEIDNTYDWARWGGRWFEQLKDEEVKILFDEVTQKALDEVQPNE